MGGPGRGIGPSLEVLLVHPGGPFFKNKDLGAWTIPQGEPVDGEELIDCAGREFVEEVGRGLVGARAGRRELRARS